MLGAGKVSIDGTKIKANASVWQSKDADALNKEINKIRKEIDNILNESIEIDEEEDEKYSDSTPAKKKLEEEKLKKNKRHR